MSTPCGCVRGGKLADDEFPAYKYLHTRATTLINPFPHNVLYENKEYAIIHIWTLVWG